MTAEEWLNEHIGREESSIEFSKDQVAALLEAYAESIPRIVMMSKAKREWES